MTAGSLTVSIQSKKAARGVVSPTIKATHSTSINQVIPHRVAFRLDFWMILDPVKWTINIKHHMTQGLILLMRKTEG